MRAALLAKVGVGLPDVAAILAMLSFRPRKYSVFDPLRLGSYLRPEETFSRAPSTSATPVSAALVSTSWATSWSATSSRRCSPPCRPPDKELLAGADPSLVAAATTGPRRREIRPRAPRPSLESSTEPPALDPGDVVERWDEMGTCWAPSHPLGCVRADGGAASHYPGLRTGPDRAPLADPTCGADDRRRTPSGIRAGPNQKLT